MLPLSEPDFLDFIYNYFKAEYAPIRSLWSTATAEPRQPRRWFSMGHELSPVSFRPANAQAQKDLESIDYCIRKWNLDANFVRGIVIRYAKYEVHERLEKKLYESSRLDLMVRKALKEKHLIDALWPSPAPVNLPQELLQQGVQVRRWYGDMFFKYFRQLRAVDDFMLRPDVDQRIKSSSTLMLVPFVDHLVFGTVDPIIPIVVKGSGYANARRQRQADTFGEPDRFEIRFDAPSEIADTYSKSVVRQSQCLKCGTRRDVSVLVLVDPSPGPVGTQHTAQRRPSHPNTSAPRRNTSKVAQRYTPGYNMPGAGEPPSRQTQALPPHVAAQNASTTVRPPSPVRKKQCPRCTFLNHAELSSCEMCQAELPNVLVEKPPSPVAVQKQKQKPAHAHSVSMPSPAAAPEMKEQEEQRKERRPDTKNRHSLSSTLFSIFPFAQQTQTEHHPVLPDTQPSGVLPATIPSAEIASSSHTKVQNPRPEVSAPRTPPRPTAPSPELHNPRPDSRSILDEDPPLVLSRPLEPALMPLTPPPVSSDGEAGQRDIPMGMPRRLMDEYVSPVSPGYEDSREGEEDAGWGDVRREDEAEGNSEEGRGEGVRMVDLDAVAREELGVWADTED